MNLTINISAKNVKRIEFDGGSLGKFIYGDLHTELIENQYKIKNYIEEESDGQFFIFCVQDQQYPDITLIQARNFYDAYEEYIDYASKHEGIRISDEELKDYKDEEYTFDSNGNPVDTEAIQGFPVKFVSLEV